MDLTMTKRSIIYNKMIYNMKRWKWRLIKSLSAIFVNKRDPLFYPKFLQVILPQYPQR